MVHLVAIGLACKEFGGLEWFTLRGGIVLTAVLLAGTYLVVQRFYQLPSVGAFVTPLTLIILLPTLFGEGGAPGVAPEALRHPAIVFHIMTASLGVSLFGLAFGVALMYLLQEREVKGKHFGALFSRLPPLDSLDKLIDRLVRLGFISFTVASILGAMIARSVWKVTWSWDPQQISTLLIWLLYGGMVQARHLGWHGRRYARLTIFAFALLIGVDRDPPHRPRHHHARRRVQGARTGGREVSERRLFLVGLSHKSAPIEVRERVALNGADLRAALQQLRASEGVAEAMVVSTCNRVEVFVQAEAEEAARRFFTSRADQASEHLYVKAGAEAVRHLFRVAASLDSMVVGEQQILGQVKEAYGLASGVQAAAGLHVAPLQPGLRHRQAGPDRDRHRARRHLDVAGGGRAGGEDLRRPQGPRRCCWWAPARWARSPPRRCRCSPPSGCW